MALEIRRTPVLEGKDAKFFLESIKDKKTRISKEEILTSILKTKKSYPHNIGHN